MKSACNFVFTIFSCVHRIDVPSQTYLGKALLVLREQHGPAGPRRADPPHLQQAGGIEIPVLLL